jgi:hypothetical protein
VGCRQRARLLPTLDGERISNTQARRICGDLDDAKLYFDLDDGSFHLKGASGYIDELVAAIDQDFQSPGDRIGVHRRAYDNYPCGA